MPEDMRQKGRCIPVPFWHCVHSAWIWVFKWTSHRPCFRKLTSTCDNIEDWSDFSFSYIDIWLRIGSSIYSHIWFNLHPLGMKISASDSSSCFYISLYSLWCQGHLCTYCLSVHWHFFCNSLGISPSYLSYYTYAVRGQSFCKDYSWSWTCMGSIIHLHAGLWPFLPASPWMNFVAHTCEDFCSLCCFFFVPTNFSAKYVITPWLLCIMLLVICMYVFRADYFLFINSGYILP